MSICLFVIYCGSHEELLELEGMYNDMWLQQQTKGDEGTSGSDEDQQGSSKEKEGTSNDM